MHKLSQVLYTFSVLRAVCLTAAHETQILHERAVSNGKDLEKAEPFMASLRSASGTHVCGGSLIHPRVVLSAAHCIRKGKNPNVDIGRYRRVGGDPSKFTSHATLDVIVHEDYDPESLDYDIALLVLASDSPHDLLPLSSSESCFGKKDGCTVRLLGWGSSSTSTLFATNIQDAFTKSVSRSTCRQLLGGSRITDRMICAGELKDGKYDTCQGDSGGPMIQDERQVGIVSFGIGCGNAQSPGVYTSVPKLRSWIDDNISMIEETLAECKCAEDGISNGVSTFRIGCKAHLKDYGDKEKFCMTVGGLACPYAVSSSGYPGTAWITC